MDSSREPLLLRAPSPALQNVHPDACRRRARVLSNVIVETLRLLKPDPFDELFPSRGVLLVH
jgi:hypothetical protein